MPVKDVVAVTIVAPTGTAVDALSTSVFVLGLEKGTEPCEKHTGRRRHDCMPGKRRGNRDNHDGWFPEKIYK